MLKQKALYFMLAAILLTLSFSATVDAGGFVHGPVITLDGEDYYMEGAPDGPNGEFDIPGHYWNQAGPNQLVGKHYNTGPNGAASWWATMEEDGALLYTVHAIIDTWSAEKADSYAGRGYVHYHELRSVNTGMHHATKVVWLKHTAVKAFYFDGGPHPELSHDVTPGLDSEFIPNGSMPYMP